MMGSDVKKKDEYFRLIRKIVEEMKYGSVTIIVQDGKIMQIQKEEKIRITEG